MSNNNNNRAPGQRRRTRRGKGQGPKANQVVQRTLELETALLDPRRQQFREHIALRHAAEPAILAFVDPELSGGFRWSEPLAQWKTGVCTPQTTVPVGFATTDIAHTSDPLALSETFAISRRIPQCANIHFDHNTADKLKQYDIYWAPEMATDPALSATYSLMAARPENLRPIFAKASSALPYQPHGPVLYAGTDPVMEKRFLWADYGDTVSVRVSPSAGPATINLVPFIFDPMTNKTTQGTALSSGPIGAGATYTFNTVMSTIVPSGNVGRYIAFQVQSDVNCTLTVDQSNVAGSGRCFAHRALSQYNLNDKYLQRIRILGMSQMFSNRAPTQYKQGKVVSCQIDEGIGWGTYTTYDSVNGLNGAHKRDADNGLYAFMRPLSERDLDMKNYTLQKNDVLVDSFWPLAGNGSFLVTVMSINVATGRDGEWTFDQSIEFTTLNQFCELRTPSMSYQECQRAASTISTIEQFHENPLHVRELVAAAKKAAKSIGSAVLKGAPIMAEAAVKYGPQIIKLAQLIASL